MIVGKWSSLLPQSLLIHSSCFLDASSIAISRAVCKPWRDVPVSKLDRIRLDKGWDGLPLSEVIKDLGDESRKRDPERKGINFIINPNTEAASAAAPTAFTSTGKPLPRWPRHRTTHSSGGIANSRKSQRGMMT